MFAEQFMRSEVDRYLGLPGQALSALPYLATIVALIVLSLKDRRGSAAPGSLGTVSIPDR